MTDPEQKRKIIGRDFVEVFNAEAKLMSMDGELYGLDEDDVAYLWRNELDLKTRVLTK